MGRTTVRAVVFDAGHTLLEMDYARLTAYVASRGHHVSEAAVTDAERRARMRLDTERAAQASRERTGEGRYVRYLTEYLGITDDAERRAIAEWRRGFNVPIGLCHQADGDAPKALQRAREAGLVVGVISNSNGSVKRALEIAGLAPLLDFVIDSSVVGVSSPTPGSSCSAWRPPAPRRRRPSTSATRTSSTWSAPVERAWARSCSIRAARGAGAIARSLRACVRRSSTL